MMLSSLDHDRLSRCLSVIDHALAGTQAAQRTFRRIAGTLQMCPGLKADSFAHHDNAVALAQALGMTTVHEAPSQSFSWDGQAVRTGTETAVLLHEIAHWQIAPRERRCLPDFGLGAGPETGLKAQADAARCVDDTTKEREEDQASLLGILWEVELGGPALIAFCEQNWLELYDRPRTAEHFISVFSSLQSRGLINEDGRPGMANPTSAAA